MSIIIIYVFDVCFLHWNFLKKEKKNRRENVNFIELVFKYDKKKKC